MSNVVSIRRTEEKVFQLVYPLESTPLSFYPSGQVNIIVEGTITTLTEQVVTLPRGSQAGAARDFLRRQLVSVAGIEDILYRVEEVDRQPGFIIDFLILITDRNRDTKRSVFSALGNLMRTHPHLLFDFRIVSRGERDRGDIVPEGYVS